MTIADRIAVLDKGRVIQHGTPEELLQCQLRMRSEYANPGAEAQSLSPTSTRIGRELSVASARDWTGS